MAENATTTQTEPSDLPDTGFSWGEHLDNPENTPEMIAPEPSTLPDKYQPTRYSKYGNKEIALALGDVDEYLEQHETKTLDVPSTYKEIDHNRVYAVTYESTDTSFGVPGKLIEFAIRIACGGGHYSADDYSITCPVGKTLPWVFHAPDHDYLLAPKTVDLSDDYDYTATANVAGMTVRGEQDSSVLSGIEPFCEDLAEYADLTIDRFVERDGSRLVFETEDGITVRIRGYSLKTYGSFSRDPSELLGEHEYDSEFYDVPPITYTIEELPDGLGEQYLRMKDSYVIGCRHSEDMKTRRYRDDGPYAFSATLKTAYMELSWNDDRDRVSVKVSRQRNTSTRVHYVEFD